MKSRLLSLFDAASGDMTSCKQTDLILGTLAWDRPMMSSFYCYCCLWELLFFTLFPPYCCCCFSLLFSIFCFSFCYFTKPQTLATGSQPPSFCLVLSCPVLPLIGISICFDGAVDEPRLLQIYDVFPLHLNLCPSI